MSKKALLVLEDGTFYEGKPFGKEGEAFGEVVFNTCMTGYQEVLTDPSYRGQIVVMTYPLIGNYGFNNEDNESSSPQVQGFVVKELCNMASNWRNVGTPSDFFIKHGIPGICDIDTRHLTQHIRNNGSMYGVISTLNDDVQWLARKAKELAAIKQDLVSAVTCREIRHIEGSSPRIAILDLGVKASIIRSLVQLGCEIYVIPAHAPASSILDLKPDGILLSNGPGDPRDIPYALKTVKQLLGKRPIMGICLGHQLLGLALGASSYKMKFGHHGGNHPVKDLNKNRVYITSQNHNYALNDDLGAHAHVTHVNLNDGSIEGFSHEDFPLISVQYHPEAAPGPQDSGHIFEEFINLIRSNS
jgi:carbamoyl-phosphate synthase small subunit